MKKARCYAGLFLWSQSISEAGKIISQIPVFHSTFGGYFSEHFLLEKSVLVIVLLLVFGFKVLP